jgi:hypothetical protein
LRLFIALSFASLLSAQNPDSTSAPACTIAGHVVNSITGAPLRKAQVRLLREDPATAPPGGAAKPEEPPETISAADGAFSFTGLTPGAYRVYAERVGFQSRSWGAKDRSSQGQVLRLGPSEKRDDIAIELIPLSVITGKVVDEDGDPVPNTQVQVLVPVYAPSGRELQPRGATYTNDLGEYRLYSLQARKYYLRADPQGGNMVGGPRGRRARETLVAAYYPGSPDPSGAAPVELAPGRQLNGIDFTLHMGHRVTVSGRLVAPPGATNLMITYSQYVRGGSTTTSFEASDPAGHFTMRNLATGDYILGARYNLAGEDYNAFLPITVGQTDVEDLELHPAPPVEVTGRVRFDGPPSEKLGASSIVLNAKLGHSQSMAKIQNDGTFASRGLAPDVYHVGLNTTAEAFLKEARWGDVNALESGLDLSAGTSASDVKIVVSTAVGSLDGTVQSDKQEALAGAAVALRPEASSSGDDPYNDPRFKGAKAGPDGKFHLTGLTPGRYRLMAWDDVDENTARYDPDFVQQIASRGQLIEVGEGEHKNVSVQVTTKPEEPQ